MVGQLTTAVFIKILALLSDKKRGMQNMFDWRCVLGRRGNVYLPGWRLQRAANVSEPPSMTAQTMQTWSCASWGYQWKNIIRNQGCSHYLNGGSTFSVFGVQPEGGGSSVTSVSGGGGGGIRRLSLCDQPTMPPRLTGRSWSTSRSRWRIEHPCPKQMTWLYFEKCGCKLLTPLKWMLRTIFYVNVKGPVY